MPRAKKPGAAPPPKLNTNTGMNLPATPPGLPYGQAQAAQQAMSAMPAGGPSGATTPLPAGPGAAPTPAPGAAPNQAQIMQALQQYQMPAGSLTAPTNNPQEPVTAGLPTGPGAGPVMADPTMQDVLAWKPYLPSLVFMASQPDATMSTKQFARRLLSMMPPTNPPGTGTPAGPAGVGGV